ncbi:hypothetical protein ACI3KS_09740 [Microbacterium sp. ZW T5_45]|uniref:hypothetical protein n=1 Tax=Microbacterium sp. ZW T5_45 TaxID=3378080 RepID=UPI0038544178
MNIVRFGRPVPWRGIIASMGIGAGMALFTALLGILSGRFHGSLLLLLFLLIPVVVSPILIAINTFATFDPQTGLISINGAAPVPLAHVTQARTMTTRGVATLYLGTGPTRAERFFVANGPFGSPRVERDWVRHLLPYTGLPRSGVHPDEFGTRHVRQASFEEASVFAHRWLN